MRAPSGAEALETLSELRRRGEQVALLIADQRMPGMEGTEYLTKARTIFPEAKRALLTAYADTNAAIAAINEASIDYYLLKPWDPPEEELYPVIEDLLAEWQVGPGLRREACGSSDTASRRTPTTCATSWPGTDPRRFLDVERDSDARDLLRWRTSPMTACPSRSSRTARSSSARRSSSWRRASGHRTPRPTTTTWSSSAAGPPASPWRSTAHRRGCTQSWSSARRQAVRPGSPAASRTTSASRPDSPAPISHTVRPSRHAGSAQSC